MYIDPALLDMARAQANALRDGKELPYKAPYKYKDHDGHERLADEKWFDAFVKDFYGKENKLPYSNTNELPPAK